MAIFTLIGISILRQDDAYSFQVIAKTIESVIPTFNRSFNENGCRASLDDRYSFFFPNAPWSASHMAMQFPIFDKYKFELCLIFIKTKHFRLYFSSTG